MNEVPPKITKNIQKLDEIATELRRGKDFNITRLTLLKGFCNDAQATAQFDLHLAKKTQQAMKHLLRRSNSTGGSCSKPCGRWRRT